jgi:uncharacterized protein YaeQ
MIVRIPTLARMHFLAREFIFNKKDMPDAWKRELLEGIDQWKRRKHTPANQAREIHRICEAIAADAKGGYGYVKETIARHKLDYRRLYKDGV